jgi:hypothetical protein
VSRPTVKGQRRKDWVGRAKRGGVVSDAERARLIADFLARGGTIKYIVGAEYRAIPDRCTPAETRNMEQSPR